MSHPRLQLRSDRLAAVLLLGAALCAGCASTPRLGRVLPDSGPVMKAVSEAATREEAEQSAGYTAESACRERRREYVFLDLRTQYQGLVAEETRRTLEQMSEVAENNGVGALPSLVTDSDYRSIVRFKCEV